MSDRISLLGGKRAREHTITYQNGNGKFICVSTSEPMNYGTMNIVREYAMTVEDAFNRVIVNFHSTDYNEFLCELSRMCPNYVMQEHERREMSNLFARHVEVQQNGRREPSVAPHPRFERVNSSPVVNHSRAPSVYSIRASSREPTVVYNNPPSIEPPVVQAAPSVAQEAASTQMVPVPGLNPQVGALIHQLLHMAAGGQIPVTMNVPQPIANLAPPLPIPRFTDFQIVVNYRYEIIGVLLTDAFATAHDFKKCNVDKYKWDMGNRQYTTVNHHEARPAKPASAHELFWCFERGVWGTAEIQGVPVTRVGTSNILVVNIPGLVLMTS